MNLVKHFDIQISSGEFTVDIRYGVLKGQGVLISSHLRKITKAPTGYGIQGYPGADLTQIVNAIIEHEIA